MGMRINFNNKIGKHRDIVQDVTASVTSVHICNDILYWKVSAIVSEMWNKDGLIGSFQS